MLTLLECTYSTCIVFYTQGYEYAPVPMWHCHFILCPRKQSDVVTNLSTGCMQVFENTKSRPAVFPKLQSGFGLNNRCLVGGKLADEWTGSRLVLTTTTGFAHSEGGNICRQLTSDMVFRCITHGSLDITKQIIMVK
jgi:hypothetical protein